MNVLLVVGGGARNLLFPPSLPSATLPSKLLHFAPLRYGGKKPLQDNREQHPAAAYKEIYFFKKTDITLCLARSATIDSRGDSGVLAEPWRALDRHRARPGLASWEAFVTHDLE